MQKLNQAINTALQLPEVRAKVDPTGAEIVGGTSEEFGKMLKANMEKFKRIVSEAGIKPQKSRTAICAAHITTAELLSDTGAGPPAPAWQDRRCTCA